MKKIILLCAGGMSTSVLVNSMKKAATAVGYEVEIDAHAVDSAEKVAKDADSVLLGPQISYQLDEVANKLTAPVEVIDMMDYGMMDGEKVLQQARRMMGDI